MNIQRTYDPHRDLLELHGLERPACSNTLVPRGSHHISSLWSPVVATGGNRQQIGESRKPQKQAKTVAVGCDWLRKTFLGRRRSISFINAKSCEPEGPQDLTGRL